MSFTNAYNEYIKYATVKYKPTTVLFIKRKFNNYIIPYFKNYNIEDIDLNIYIDFIYYIFSKGYAYSFNCHIISIMKAFYNYLFLVYSIKNIPSMVGNINFNSFSSSNHIIKVWSLKEFKKFIKKVDDPVYHALFNTLFFTGMRKGEILALTFDDIINNYIYVNKTITKELFDGKRLITTPKTKASNRKIRIDFFLKRELLKLKKYYKKLYGNFSDNFYVFGGITPLSTTTLERRKNIYCKLAKINPIRIHDFRHSHATLLYNKNVKIKYIQERLGHSSIETTLNTYVHNNDRYEKRVLGTLNFLKFKI